MLRVGRCPREIILVLASHDQVELIEADTVTARRATQQDFTNVFLTESVAHIQIVDNFR